MPAYDNRPKWRQIADHLRAMITDGVLKPGDDLPSETRLADKYGVVRMTARNALLALEQDGLVTTGRPRKVASYEQLTVHVTRTADRTSEGEGATDGADSWLADMATAGKDTAQEIEVVTEGASTEVARRLGTAPDELVTCRRLVRSAGDRPHNLISFWFPVAVSTGTLLAQPGSIAQGSLSWLEERWGPLEHQVDVTWRMPTATETQRLHIPPGIPVGIVWRVSWHGTDWPLVASMAVYPGDRTRLRLHLAGATATAASRK